MKAIQISVETRPKGVLGRIFKFLEGLDPRLCKQPGEAGESAWCYAQAAEGSEDLLGFGTDGIGSDHRQEHVHRVDRG